MTSVRTACVAPRNDKIKSSKATASGSSTTGICYFTVDSAKDTRSGRMLEGARFVNATSKTRAGAQTAFTIQRLWRQAVWGCAAAAALLLAVLAAFTDIGSQRAALVFAASSVAPAA